MRAGWCCLTLLAAVVCTDALRPTAARADNDWGVQKLALMPDDNNVYAPVDQPREDQGINTGGVNFNLNVDYFSDYVYRGINHDLVGGDRRALNLQFDGSLEFNLGRYPHPFVGVFANVYDNDPISRFQEFRPYFGLDWRLKPLTIMAGNNSYIFPEREHFNTSEVWVKLTLDDSYIFHTEQPILSPYGYAAYDYDLNKGFYFEAGVKHDFVFEDTGLKLTVVADAAYIEGIKYQFIFANRKDYGFSHYDVGLIATYSLNQLLHFSNRYGTFTLNGYIYYTDSPNRGNVRADTLLWGGAGIGFHY